jgi:excinuclease ABC subunit A
LSPLDPGPESGEAGGYVVAEGTPEEVARIKASYTGQYLKKVLKA